MTRAQSTAFDERSFRAMTDAGRYRFVQGFSFSKMDSAAAWRALNRMLDIGREKRDSRSVMAVLYRRYTERLVLNPKDSYKCLDNAAAALSEMESIARQGGFGVEETVGRFYLKYEAFLYRRLPREKMYVEIRSTFERMERLGFEQFRDYGYEFILRCCIKFMWEMEDFEEAYQYLTVAERVISPSQKNYKYYITVLNLLQTYWQQQKKDLSRAIDYAEKIRRFYENFQSENPEERWMGRFWQGFSLLSIAEMRLEQGDTSGVESYANQGYAWVKREETNTNIYAYIAEYEALNVYVPIKITLGKMEEAGLLLKRAGAIKEKIGVRWEMNVFKHIKFYENYARYHELQGSAGQALRYAKLARVLHDSLDRHNGVLKYEYIKQRLEAEKYAAQLQLVESEKELHKALRNAAFIILALVLLLALSRIQHQRYLRRRQEAELEAARNELGAMTANFLEKAEMAQKLHAELQRLSAAGEHS
ncbi:MAG: hypothetical protein L6Q97_11080, partial [Thermoanaerobaculia bacterium]|nr:hypothetical protein [Thermoanaerobaculia bacterium]